MALPALFGPSGSQDHLPAGHRRAGKRAADGWRWPWAARPGGTRSRGLFVPPRQRALVQCPPGGGACSRICRSRRNLEVQPAAVPTS